MPTPRVSVIVPVYNAQAYLHQCLGSVFGQTIGVDQLEIIAVDDGSTDGSGAALDQLAAEHPQLTVIHQQNSGGPGAPRNRAVKHARGEYVFFLDADDYLGSEALDRLVKAAERNAADIVMGKIVGAGDRSGPKAAFRRAYEKADLFDSGIYWSLSGQKLFRRDLIERYDLRFVERATVSEDLSFTGHAFLHASAITVLTDYDYYHLRGRDDGGNVTRSRFDLFATLGAVGTALEVIGAHTEPGPDRDRLVRRHVEFDVPQNVSLRLLDLDEDERRRALAAAREVLAPWVNEGILESLTALRRLQVHCILHDLGPELAEIIAFTEAGMHRKAVVDKGRVYAAYPHFRDPRRPIPDAVFDTTDRLKLHHHLAEATWQDGALQLRGHAYIGLIDTVDSTVELVLRERETAVEHRIPATTEPSYELTARYGNGVYDYDHAGFVVDLDPARAVAGRPLPAGVWDVSVAVGVQGVEKEIRLGARRTPEAAPPACDVAQVGLVSPYFTREFGNLTLAVGEDARPLARAAHLDVLGWAADSAAVLVSGQIAARLPAETTASVVLRSKRGERLVPAAVQVTDDRLAFAARVAPESALPPGDWKLALAVEVGDRRYDVALPARGRRLDARRWWRRGRPMRVAVTTSGGLTLQVHPIVARALKQRLRPS